MPLHNLTRFPRLEFIGAPTPLEYLPRFSDYLGREIFIKRDDVTPMAMGGNKLRKLEFLAADALREGADTLITAGAIQSNHVRQTAAVAAKLGLHCVALLENPIGTTAENYLTNGNRLLLDLFNTQIEMCDALTDPNAQLEELATRVEAQGFRPYVIPVGGSNALGALGYVEMEGTYPPFSFQGDDGKLTGFEVEFAQQLAKHLGVEASLKPTKWDGMLASLDSKRIDVVINQVTISDERKKKYDFSTPYTISGIQALVKKGNEGTIKTADDLKGKKVGVGLGTNYEEWLRQNVQGVDVRTYDDDPTKYQDLRVGRIDAILVDRLAALDLVKKTNDTLAVTGEAFSRQESGVALRKGNEDLLKAVNDAIAEMQKDGTLQALSEKWFGADVTK